MGQKQDEKQEQREGQYSFVTQDIMKITLRIHRDKTIVAVGRVTGTNEKEDIPKTVHAPTSKSV